MSRVVLLREGLPNLLPMQGRSPGVHCSTVITDIAIRMGYLSGKAELSTTWAQLGCALERSIIWAYERDMPGRYIQPGEQVLDNIYCTPDLADHCPLMDNDLDDGTVALIGAHAPIPEEIKCSWMGSAHTPRECEACGGKVECPKFWRYEAQLKAECVMPYYKGATAGKLTVVHINGEQRKHRTRFGPDGKPWLLAYTRDEIDANWSMIVEHGHTLRCSECGGSGTVRMLTCRACNGSGVKLEAA